MLLCVFDPRLSYLFSISFSFLQFQGTLLLMVECADCKLVSLGFNSLNVLFDLEFLFILEYILFYIFDSNISLSRFTTDCCVIGNVSTLGVGIWGFKSLQSDRFLYIFLYTFNFFSFLSFVMFYLLLVFIISFLFFYYATISTFLLP